MTVGKINNNTNIESKDASQCKKLRQVIRDATRENLITEGECDTLLRNISKNKELASMKIKQYLCSGASATVFETEDGDVLKITEGSHYPLGRKQESFDVPIKKTGTAGILHYYIEEKLMQHNMTDGFVEIIKNEIHKKGYKPNDLDSWDLHQIGLSKDGKLYLLDPECALHKSIFHALWYKFKNRNK